MGWTTPESGRAASCSTGSGCSRSRDPPNGVPWTRSSAGLPPAESACSRPCGGTPNGCPAATRIPRSTGSRTYGPGRTSSRRWWPLRTHRQLLGRSAISTQHPGATPLPIQSWQIWNEPNLKKFYVPYPSPQSYARLVQLSHAAIRSKDATGPDRARRNARLRGHEGLGLPQDLLQPGRDQELLRRRRPAPLRVRPRPRPPPDPECPGGDGEPRRPGHAAVAHRARLGLGSSRPASGSTRASRVKTRCSGTPTG